MRSALRASSQALRTQSTAVPSCPNFRPLRRLAFASILNNTVPRRTFSICQRRCQSLLNRHDDFQEQSGPASLETVDIVKTLPLVCPGCGAPSQTIHSDNPGFYDLTRPRNQRDRSTGEWKTGKSVRQQEDEIYQKVIGEGVLGKTAPSSVNHVDNSPSNNSSVSSVPICDRCHDLLHQSRGKSIIHPSMRSIQDIIEESPHKHNHIYHVVDAADFPMSLIPNLVNALDLPKQRTKNRRAKNIRHARGRVAEVSFIITRSDLLAPKKEQVDTLMPYLQDVLRDALGRSGRNVRLGNVRCVSAKRGWWTKNVKEEIWARGGAGWMVGKVNVGKSALFEVVFPKGRNQNQVGDQARRNMENKVAQQAAEMEPEKQSETTKDVDEVAPFDEYDEGSLLPPAQPETAYPTMPLVSSLPGTTASPIRIPFGAGKGELIDLPGIDRSSLDTHVVASSHKELVMRARVTPESFTIKPGQSLILGGLIRITPHTDDIVMAYPFVPPAFQPHVTGTHKAIAIQTGTHSAASIGREGEAYTGTVDSIATEEAKQLVKSAGTFPLQWNETKRRAGPLTDRTAGKQKADALPFTIYSTDILIEGVGWVELACQTRKRIEESLPLPSFSAQHDGMSALLATAARKPQSDSSQTTSYEPFSSPASSAASSTLPPSPPPEPAFPSVEVFTPTGKFIAQRRPMNASILSGGDIKTPVHLRRQRPRQSIGMMKRRQNSKKSAS
ncbi:Hypothetical protein R9X50_00687700 [Acrodontium crateriforme]|uniref:Uncharacterized protein n=1 Tax=Acrodontium crateriforme TaxID=150365 RepID=A0AAQ3MAW3_9PEZI|nr:Hypothetical protein R9X50_00687700 [Acrodontium crateriforme]